MNDEVNAKSLGLHVLELHVGVKEIFRDQTFQFVLIEMARKNRRNIFVSDSLQRMSNKTDIFFVTQTSALPLEAGPIQFHCPWNLGVVQSAGCQQGLAR